MLFCARRPRPRYQRVSDICESRSEGRGKGAARVPTLAERPKRSQPANRNISTLISAPKSKTSDSYMSDET